MVARTRTSVSSFPGGGTAKRWLNGSLISSFGPQAPIGEWTKSQCDDATGYLVDHTLSITHQSKASCQPLNGTILTSGNVREYLNWMPNGLNSNTSHLTILLDSDGVVATRTKALSNPSRAYVSIPNFLFELKDLPGMIRDIGKLKLIGRRARSLPHWQRGKPLTAKDAANLQLSYQMGWQPLISDLRRMLDFQQKVDRRINDLENLFVRNRGLRRVVGKERAESARRRGAPGMWKSTVNTSSTSTVESNLGIILSCRVEKTTSMEKWGSVRWTSTALPGTRYSNRQLRILARSLVFGLNHNPKALWDAIPWSWLVDWFTNVGDFLEANTNVIPVQCSNVCVMTHTRTEEVWSRTNFELEVHGGYGTKILETKKRSLNAGTLSATFPFISGRQFSILGALAIQRMKR